MNQRHNRYDAPGNFVTPEPTATESTPSLDLIPHRDAVAVATRVLDTYADQQRHAQAAVRAVEGDIVDERSRSTSTAAELVERRKTQRMYVWGIVAACGMTVAGVELPFAVGLWGTAALTSSLLFWAGLWAFGTGAASVAALVYLHSNSQEHTPEGLTRQRERNDHEVRMLYARAEVKRHDAITERMQVETERLHLQNAQLQRKLADNARQQSQVQHEHNQLAAYRPEPTEVAADDEVFRHKLLTFICNPEHYDSGNGLFTTTVPWSARGGFDNADSERAKRFFKHAEAFNGVWVVAQRSGNRWAMNVDKFPTPDAVFAALEHVETPAR